MKGPCNHTEFAPPGASLRREYISYKERNQLRTEPLPIVRATLLLLLIDISFSMRERKGFVRGFPPMKAWQTLVLALYNWA